MGKTYWNQCPYCGARLDPGERCDCRKAKAERRPAKPTTKPVKEKIA